MSVQSSIILRLIEQIPDQHLRDQITAQYYQDVEAQANFVQNRVGHLEIDLREMLQTTIGETNDMISEAVASSRENGKHVAEVVAELRASRVEQEALRRTAEQGFHATEQRFTEIDANLEHLGTEFGTFRLSVDSRFQSVDDKIEAQGALWRERRDQVDASLSEQADRIAQLESQVATLRDLLTRERGV